MEMDDTSSVSILCGVISIISGSSTDGISFVSCISSVSGAAALSQVSASVGFVFHVILFLIRVL